jgi:hypothetical protein
MGQEEVNDARRSRRTLISFVIHKFGMLLMQNPIPQFKTLLI